MIENENASNGVCARCTIRHLRNLPRPKKTFQVSSIPCPISYTPWYSLLLCRHPLTSHHKVPNFAQQYKAYLRTHISKKKNQNRARGCCGTVPFVNLVGAVAGGIPLVVRRGLEVKLVAPPLSRLALPLRFQAPKLGYTHQNKEIVINIKKNKPEEGPSSPPLSQHFTPLRCCGGVDGGLFGTLPLRVCFVLETVYGKRRGMY